MHSLPPYLRVEKRTTRILMKGQRPSVVDRLPFDNVANEIPMSVRRERGQGYNAQNMIPGKTIDTEASC